MPTYDYVCGSCGHRFEEFQPMTAKALRKCPKCGKPALERLIGVGAGIIFKGSGFYETDYRSEGYKKAAEAEKKSAEPAKADAGGCACGKGGCGAAPAKAPEKKPAAKEKKKKE
jgi:putative FmdB family regulatory protein